MIICEKHERCMVIYELETGLEGCPVCEIERVRDELVQEKINYELKINKLTKDLTKLKGMI